MEKHRSPVISFAADFLVAFVLAIQLLLTNLALAIGGGAVRLIILAVKVVIIVFEAHYLFGAVGGFIALFVESGKEWWWFFWEFLEMSVKLLLFNAFLVAVHAAICLAQDRRRSGS